MSQNNTGQEFPTHPNQPEKIVIIPEVPAAQPIPETRPEQDPRPTQTPVEVPKENNERM